MRILNATANLIPLDQLILIPSLSQLVREKAFSQSGLILVCGPTGSGKTTTLYSALTERVRFSSDINIMTVEDPIEYTLRGASQTQVNHHIGLGFADVLRSFLRHDPNVIMVGETRDGETARIASQAALTGHLVMTSLHATDTLSALTRMKELGLESYLLSSTLLVLIGQRLIRKLCPHCSAPSEFPQEVFQGLVASGVLKEKDKVEIYHGRGCEECGFSGYAGRLGVYEVLPVTPKVKEMISLQTPKHEFVNKLNEKDWVTFADYCRFLLKNKLTDAAEVLRIVSKEERNSMI